MKPVITPAFLQEGDTIGIIAPARFALKEDLLGVVEILNSLSFSVKFANNIGVKQGQFAGSDQARTEGIHQMMIDPDVKALLCARGGYGSARLFSSLSKNVFLNNPKWLCGFSDVTALHLLSRYFGISSMHTPVATTLAAAPKEIKDHFKLMLLGNKTWSFQAEIHGDQNWQFDDVELIGGNLSLLYSLKGSHVYPISTPHVLMMEDLDEMLYHLDRMLMGLELAHAFGHTKAIFIGHFSDFKDNTEAYGFSSNNPYGQCTKSILIERLQSFGIPLVFNCPFGHEHLNQSWLHGHPCSVQCINGLVQVNYL